MIWGWYVRLLILMLGCFNWLDEVYNWWSFIDCINIVVIVGMKCIWVKLNGWCCVVIVVSVIICKLFFVLLLLFVVMIWFFLFSIFVIVMVFIWYLLDLLKWVKFLSRWLCGKWWKRVELKLKICVMWFFSCGCFFSF